MAINHFISIKNTQLRKTLISLLHQQQNKVAKVTFLTPDVQHVFRVENNVRLLIKNNKLRAQLEAKFGFNYQKIAIFAVWLSKVGFGHPNLDITNNMDYQNNRSFMLELLVPLKESLKEELLLTDDTYKLFIEALLREGTFGCGTGTDLKIFQKELKSIKNIYEILKEHDFQDENFSDFTRIKYENPLTSLLTIASEIDISQMRLQAWQRHPTGMHLLLEISNDPLITILNLEKAFLDIEMIRQTETSSTKMAHLERQIIENKKRLNAALRQVINRDVVEKEVEIRNKIVHDGLDEQQAKSMFQSIATSFFGMTEQTYLWYASSLCINEIRILENGHLLRLYQNDNPETLAVINLPHIRNFHFNRITNIVKKINDAIDVNISIDKKEVLLSKELRDKSQSLFKGDTHMHLKMSVMTRRIWESIVGPAAADIYTDVFEESQKIFNKLRNKRNLPPIDLQKIMLEANRTTNELYSFIKKYNASYAWPDDVDQIVLDALGTVNEHIVELSQNEMELIKYQAKFYFSLKFHVTKLFIFTDGTLPDFVDHFTAISKMVSKVSATDVSTTLKLLTYDMLIDAAKCGVWYVEPRFNIGNSIEETLDEILLVIQAKKDLEKVNSHLPVPYMRIVLSISKFPDQLLSDKERVSHKNKSAEIFINILKDAQMRYLAGNYPYRTSHLESSVTPEEILQTIVGIDAAGQEEYNPPSLFFDAYQMIKEYNQDLYIFNQDLLAEKIQKLTLLMPIGMTYHVAESIDDVSVESGIRHLFEALFMKPFHQYSEDDPSVLSRIGQGIIVALFSYMQLLKTQRMELVKERIEQIKFDLMLLKLKIPLLSVKEIDLEEELNDLNIYAELYAQKNISSTARKLLNDIILRRGIKDDQVTYSYDDIGKIIDIEIRAGLAKDFLIKYDIVVETNPTSNISVSPFINSYREHSLKEYLNYSYGDWTREPKLLAELENRKKQVFAGNSNEAVEAMHQLQQLDEYRQEGIAFLGSKVRASINTDDGALFGINLVDEYYRMAVALGLSVEKLEKIAEESIQSALQPLSPSEIKLLKDRLSTGIVELRAPKRIVGGLNEFIIDKLREFSDQIVTQEDDPPILQEGEEEDGFFYLVLEGSVNIFVGGQCISSLHKNEIFGELAGPFGRRSATVKAAEPSTMLLKIDKIELLCRFNKNIAVRTYFENLISSRDQSGVFKSLDAHFGFAGQSREVNRP